MMDELLRGCRKTHSEKLHNFYCYYNIVSMIKYKRIGWVGHVECMGNERNAYRSENVDESHLEDRSLGRYLCNVRVYYAS